jgi:uncharacterized protein YkwD
MRLVSTSVCLLSLLLVACGDGSLSAIEEDLLVTINQERTSRGMSPVELNDQLVCAAQHHSEDIGGRQACSHDDADGSGPGERVEACGGGGWSGEIVACGQTTPRDAVDGWLNSPGHKAIMLDPDQKTVGVAMSENYWTAVFNK